MEAIAAFFDNPAGFRPEQQDHATATEHVKAFRLILLESSNFSIPKNVILYVKVLKVIYSAFPTCYSEIGGAGIYPSIRMLFYTVYTQEYLFWLSLGTSHAVRIMTDDWIERRYICLMVGPRDRVMRPNTLGSNKLCDLLQWLCSSFGIDEKTRKATAAKLFAALSILDGNLRREQPEFTTPESVTYARQIFCEVYVRRHEFAKIQRDSIVRWRAEYGVDSYDGKRTPEQKKHDEKLAIVTRIQEAAKQIKLFARHVPPLASHIVGNNIERICGDILPHLQSTLIWRETNGSSVRFLLEFSLELCKHKKYPALVEGSVVKLFERVENHTEIMFGAKTQGKVEKEIRGWCIEMRSLREARERWNNRPPPEVRPLMLTDASAAMADDDLEIASEGIPLSLADPLTQDWIITASRGTKCLHPQCFEYTSFAGQTGKFKGKCPICNGKIGNADVGLAKDPFVNEILAELRRRYPLFDEACIAISQHKPLENAKEKELAALEKLHPTLFFKEVVLLPGNRWEESTRPTCTIRNKRARQEEAPKKQIIEL